MSNVTTLVLACDRARFLDDLVERFGSARLTWAFQGDHDAPAAWTAATDLKDLDIWVGSAHIVTAERILISLGAACIARHDDPTRLRHHEWWLPFGDQGAIIDLTIGDLRVGPLLLCAEAAVETVAVDHGRRLTGQAAVVDLVVRPLLRGRHPARTRMSEARAIWWDQTAGARERTASAGATALGRSAWSDLEQALDRRRLGGDDDEVQWPTDLCRRVARHLTAASLRPAHLLAALRHRAAVVAGRRGPLGRRQRGVVVALMGTDGSGKSTIADELDRQLTALGFHVSRVYFGMARNNLPGLALVRRLVGGGRTESAPRSIAAADSAAASATPVAASGAQALARRAGAWVYAFDYAWRSLTKVLPARRRRRVVICDRWVTDLRTNPWPGSRAADVAERLVVRPDLVVLADAPVEMIVARKAEKTIEQAAAEQAEYRATLARLSTTSLTHVADTSGTMEQAIGPLRAMIVGAAHR